MGHKGVGGDDEGVVKVAGVNGGGVGGVAKVREVSAARAEVLVTKVSSRLQVSGVDNKHGQEVSTVRAGGVNGEGRRCPRRRRRCRQQGRGVDGEVS